MIWKHDTRGDIIMVYGFAKANTGAFDAIVTLHKEDGAMRCHGFLSKVKMTRQRYESLFKYVQGIVQCDIIIEAEMPAARLYRFMFKALRYEIVSEQPCVTFDGYKSVLVRVKIHK